MSKKQSKQGTSKNSKKHVHDLSNRAKIAAEAGDYFLAREINNKIIELSSDGEAASAAQIQNDRLDFDPFLLKFGLGVICLYGTGWVVAFFH